MKKCSLNSYELSQVYLDVLKFIQNVFLHILYTNWKAFEPTES